MRGRSGHPDQADDSEGCSEEQIERLERGFIGITDDRDLDRQPEEQRDPDRGCRERRKRMSKPGQKGSGEGTETEDAKQDQPWD
jgi:hypothetical protein